VTTSYTPIPQSTFMACSGTTLTLVFSYIYEQLRIEVVPNIAELTNYVVFGSLFYGAFSVARPYSVDDRVISE
jgi:hypothetical protein